MIRQKKPVMLTRGFFCKILLTNLLKMEVKHETIMYLKNNILFLVDGFNMKLPFVLRLQQVSKNDAER